MENEDMTLPEWTLQDPSVNLNSPQDDTPTEEFPQSSPEEESLGIKRHSPESTPEPPKESPPPVQPESENFKNTAFAIWNVAGRTGKIIISAILLTAISLFTAGIWGIVQWFKML